MRGPMDPPTRVATAQELSVRQAPPAARGLTIRSFVACVFALLLMGVWIQYEERICNYGGPLAENSPPNAAVGVILILLVIGALLYRFRRQLRLTTPELVVIYAALLVAAPLMTQGMWSRFFGVSTAVPHNQDFKSYESLPDSLWPHGENLVTGPFDGKPGDFSHEGGGTLTWHGERWRGREWKCPRLSNGNDPRAAASLVATVSRRNAANEDALIPGEKFLFSCLLKANDFRSGSAYFVEMRADRGRWSTVLTGSANTSPSFSLPNGFERMGVNPVTVPVGLRESLSLRIGLKGAGALTVQDVQFFNMRAVEAVYSGVHVVRSSRWDSLSDQEHDFTVRKPDNMLSPAGLQYLLTGFIPLGQWAKPALAWTILIAALFMGFFGLNVLMRKQWLDHERFSFPMNILPRELFATETDGAGRVRLSLLRNRVMWVGFWIAMLLVLLKGLHYYYPGMPAPFSSDMWGNQRLDAFVNNPLLKAFLQNCTINVVFSLLAISLLVETDILLSIWAFFLLFQLFYLCGKAFNWSQYAGYPWEWQQNIGAFIGYAALAAFLGRQHLWRVFKHIVGRIRMDDSQEVVSYRAAALMVVAALGLILAWGVWARMGATAALLFFGYTLVCGFTASKIRAEAGMPFAYWMPYFSMWFVSALGGYAVFGAVGMLVATIASGFMFVSCFLFIAPVQVEMMELGRRFNVRLKHIGVGLALGLLGGLFIGGFTLLCWAYGRGAENLPTGWPYGLNWYFNYTRPLELAADRALAAGALYTTPATQPLNFVHNVDAKGIGLGVLLTWVFAGVRSLFTWFPLHPLGYVLATTHFARNMWFSSFLAWAVRSIVQRVGGAHTIRRGLVPFAVGMFLACIVSIIFFDIVSLVLRARGITEVYVSWP